MNDMVKSLGPALSSESSQKLYSKLPVIAVIALLLLLAWASAQLVWQFLTPANQETAATLPQAKPSRVNSTPAYSSEIASRSLFGKANVAAPKSEEPVEAPETKLNMKLRGVYAVDDPKKGFAIIANGSRPEQMVAVDGKLPGNIKLDSVYPDRVIISRAGKLETLRLPETKSTGVTFTPAKRNTPSANNSGVSQTTSLSGFRNELLKNPSKLAELVNAAPARENGKFVGYRITTLKQHPILSQVDIQSGDIITQVNGVKISSPAQGMKALQKLSKDNSVQLTLNRGGQVIEVNQTF